MHKILFLLFLSLTLNCSDKIKKPYGHRRLNKFKKYDLNLFFPFKWNRPTKKTKKFETDSYKKTKKSSKKFETDSYKRFILNIPFSHNSIHNRSYLNFLKKILPYISDPALSKNISITLGPKNITLDIAQKYYKRKLLQAFLYPSMCYLNFFKEEKFAKILNNIPLLYFSINAYAKRKIPKILSLEKEDWMGQKKFCKSLLPASFNNEQKKGFINSLKKHDPRAFSLCLKPEFTLLYNTFNNFDWLKKEHISHMPLAAFNTNLIKKLPPELKTTLKQRVDQFLSIFIKNINKLQEILILIPNKDSNLYQAFYKILNFELPFDKNLKYVPLGSGMDSDTKYIEIYTISSKISESFPIHLYPPKKASTAIKELSSMIHRMYGRAAIFYQSDEIYHLYDKKGRNKKETELQSYYNIHYFLDDSNELFDKINAQQFYIDNTSSINLEGLKKLIAKIRNAYKESYKKKSLAKDYLYGFRMHEGNKVRMLNQDIILIDIMQIIKKLHYYTRDKIFETTNTLYLLLKHAQDAIEVDKILNEKEENNTLQLKGKETFKDKDRDSCCNIF